MTPQAETYDFQTEAQQLLDLMVHSIYSNKDVFLRELISNSSDALDKRRFAALTDSSLLPSSTELEIWLEVDEEARTLSVRDNGIGMSREEVRELIGTIARSGATDFLRKLKESQAKELSPELIGQFGVGFYSSFMVANEVELITRRAGSDQAVRWTSRGEGTYTLEDTERSDPGTTVTLHLKDVDEEDGLQDYTQEWVLRQIVKRYSDFVAYPIKMLVSREVPEEAAGDSGGEATEDAPSKTKTETRVETLNSMKAIWTRPESEVDDEEYNEFYKHIAHDWTDPLLRIRATIEGTLEYRMLLFVPSQPPFDLFLRDSHRGVQLYVKRVFILDDCKELLPEYLRFLRGVVDSEDLSLNISREILQRDRQIQRMRKGIVSKVLSSFEELKKEDRDKYEILWQHFGRVLKEGLYSDFENRGELLDLVLCHSTRDDGKLTTLGDYVERMPAEQEHIYFMTGESREAIENSPHLEGLVERGFEVLILTDPVDEVWTERAPEYREKKLRSVGKGDVGLKEDDEKREKAREKFASILEFIGDRLKDDVKEVKVSSRLTSSPACLVTAEGDLTPQMEELLRASNQEVPRVKRILEVNTDHPILAKMRDLFEKDRKSQKLGDYADLLLGQALIAEGGKPARPDRFARLISDLMVRDADS